MMQKFTNIWLHTLDPPPKLTASLRNSSAVRMEESVKREKSGKQLVKPKLAKGRRQLPLALSEEDSEMQVWVHFF
jgi:hypothetical protein